MCSYEQDEGFKEEMKTLPKDEAVLGRGHEGRHPPLFWNCSSSSLLSCFMAIITALKAPFRRFPRTMWSGSALSRIPYLFLSVDSVTFRTFNSYSECQRKRKSVRHRNLYPMGYIDGHQQQCYHIRGNITQMPVNRWMGGAVMCTSVMCRLKALNTCLVCTRPWCGSPASQKSMVYTH